VPALDNARAGRRLPFTWCWFYFEDTVHEQGRAPLELTANGEDGTGAGARVRALSGRTPS
jgi:hypothetical protein